eukprot:5015092-Amphidinium_carterae.1
MEALDPFASYPLLSTGASYWREGGGKQAPYKRPVSRQLCRRHPPHLATTSSEWRPPLSEDDAWDIDDILFTQPDLLRLVLPAPTTSDAPEGTRSIQLVRMSSLAKYRSRGGWSHLYSVNHHPTHTFADLGRLVAAVLKISRSKLCFFARVIDYLDDQFHRPMWIVNVCPFALRQVAGSSCHRVSAH